MCEKPATGMPDRMGDDTTVPRIIPNPLGHK